MFHVSGAPLYGGLLAQPTNIRLGRKGLPWTNTLAYPKYSQAVAVICFNIGTRANVKKLFTAVSYEARVFAPGKPFQPSLLFVGKAMSIT